MQTQLLIIDPQVDFCDPAGALSVAGADQDMKRLAGDGRAAGPAPGPNTRYVGLAPFSGHRAPNFLGRTAAAATPRRSRLSARRMSKPGGGRRRSRKRVSGRRPMWRRLPRTGVTRSASGRPTASSAAPAMPFSRSCTPRFKTGSAATLWWTIFSRAAISIRSIIRRSRQMFPTLPIPAPRSTRL